MEQQRYACHIKGYVLCVGRYLRCRLPHISQKMTWQRQ